MMRNQDRGSLVRRSLMRGAAAIAVLCGIGLAAAACAGAPTPVPSDDHAEDIAAVVQVGDNWFDPAEVTVQPGQAVRWEWVGREEHDVVSSDRSFVSELMREGSYTHIFTEAGEFSYLCTTHTEMRGVVIVAD